MTQEHHQEMETSHEGMHTQDEVCDDYHNNYYHNQSNALPENHNEDCYEGSQHQSHMIDGEQCEGEEFPDQHQDCPAHGMTDHRNNHHMGHKH